MENSYILLIETATPVCSVALSLNGEIIALKEANEQNLHATHLTQFIAKVMELAGVELSALNAVAVSQGPGSYTGLRIGVSTAKGLCYALDVPLIAVPTLDAMVQGFLGKNQGEAYNVLFPMIDARRMEVYTASYDIQGKPLSSTVAKIVDETSFEQWSGQQVVLFGSGADKFSELFQQTPYVTVHPAFVASAAFLSSIAFQKFQAKDFEDVIYFEPFYLKDFIPTTPKKRV